MFSFKPNRKQVSFVERYLNDLQGGYYNSNLPRATDLKKIPNKPGVYILYRNQRMVYIGQAARIRGRLLNHHVYQVGIEVAWIQVKDKRLRYCLEQVLIYCFEPAHNQHVLADVYTGTRLDQLIERYQGRVGVQLPLSL